MYDPQIERERWQRHREWQWRQRENELAQERERARRWNTLAGVITWAWWAFVAGWALSVLGIL